MTKEPVLPCFVCGKVLKSVWPDSPSEEQQADDACYFRSHGQYGSAVFDPFDTSYLEINICDGCLGAHPERALICKPQVVKSRRSAIWTLLNRDEDE